MLRTFFNQRAAIWDGSVSEKDPAKLEQMAGRLDIKSGSIILDVGTGTGVFIPFLLSKTGKSGWIVALDFAEEMLREAQAKRFDGNINYLCANIAGIPFTDGIFDAIVCYSSFPHFQDKPIALAEMNRVTKEGGKLFICHTSSRAGINEIHRQIPAVANDIIPGEGEMRTLLLMAGFTGIEIDDNSENYLASAIKPASD